MWPNVLKLLKGVPAIAWVIAVVAALLVGGVAAYGAHQRSIGYWQARTLAAEVWLSQAGRETRRLGAVVDSLSRLEAPAVVTQVRWRQRWDTVRLSVPDTGPVAVVVGVADSAIASCERVNTLCRESRAALLAQLRVTEQQRDTLAALRPRVDVPRSTPKGNRWLAPVALAVGIAAGVLILR